MNTYVEDWEADLASPDAFNWALLHPDLKPYVQTTSWGGQIVKAPLIVEITPVIPNVNRRYEVKKALLAEFMGKRNWRGALALIERPFRMNSLLDWNMAGTISDRTLRQLMPWAWSDAEPDDTDPAYLDMWRTLRYGPFGFQRFKIGDQLPTKDRMLTVYRGQHTADETRGIAWSLDPGVAKGFACRYNQGEFGAVLRGTLDRRNVIVYINESGRGESECVCDPTDVTDVKVQIMPVIGGPDGTDLDTGVWR